MDNNKGELIAISLVALLAFCLIINSSMQNNEIEKNSVYIIGKKIAYSEGGEGFPDWEYAYIFQGLNYTKKFRQLGEPFMYSDSLLFLKISPKHPEICRQVTEFRVPKCLKILNTPKGGWEKLPLEYCDSLAYTR